MHFPHLLTGILCLASVLLHQVLTKSVNDGFPDADIQDALKINSSQDSQASSISPPHQLTTESSNTSHNLSLESHSQPVATTVKSAVPTSPTGAIAKTAVTPSSSSSNASSVNGTIQVVSKTAVLLKPTPKGAEDSQGVDAVLPLDTPGNVSSKNKKFFTSGWLWWVDDSYTISILVPVAGGIAAASVILILLWCISCCKHRYRMRNRMRIHKELNPRNIRKLKAADRIKLLAETSDEEF